MSFIAFVLVQDLLQDLLCIYFHISLVSFNVEWILNLTLFFMIFTFLDSFFEGEKI